MVPIKTLLPDLKNLVTELDEDLLARAQQDDKIDAGLREAFQQVEKGGRTAQAFEVWREDYLDQVAVAWVLGCVFVRFMEDNHLIDECWLAGEKERRKLAEDTHELFFRKHPHDTDREYFHHIFHEVGKIPAAKELFAEGKTPLWAVAPSGDAAMKLLAFWREIDAETGHLKRSFEVEEGDTRFLGDLYQELSEKAKKKYALLQTPIFVEEFILDRTLSPAIDEFGLEKLRLIDPTCGSGHFLLGAFARLFRLWMKRESNEIVAAQKALDSVWGVDINPFAVAIARFRLIVAAIQACGIKNLKRGHAPGWKIHLAAGDSLLFGSKPGFKGERTALHRQGDLFEVPAIYAVEESKAVDEILDQGYHVVVGNPPYIIVRDKRQNAAYRGLYSTCHQKFSLGVPFTQRFWELAIQQGESNGGCGYIGMITANSFMKREFGKKLIEDLFPKIDLTHILDTAGAYIPGHGTPTVILFGRSRKPQGETVRAVLGIKGEPTTPDDASNGLVWQSIVKHIDRAGLQDNFTSTVDVSRTNLYTHPWSIGGGGAAELKELLDDRASTTLQEIIRDIGFMAISGEDDVFASPEHVLRRGHIPYRPFCIGEAIRDWVYEPEGTIVFPYDEKADALNVLGESSSPMLRYFWASRTVLRNRNMFGKTPEQHGLAWFEYMQFIRYRASAKVSIAFPEVASHNHFVLDRGGKIFKQTAPMIMLRTDATEQDHLALLGLLNSSTTGFYMKQVCHQKQMTGGDGVRVTSRAKVPYQYAGTRLLEIPIPESFMDGSRRTRLQRLSSRVDECAKRIANLTASSAVSQGTQGGESRIKTLFREYEAERSRLRSEMIFLQEEIDFTVYVMFGMAEENLLCDQWEWPEVSLEVGQRPFELLQQCNVDDFQVPKGIPAQWPELLRSLWQQRMDAIRKSKDLELIEDDHYKRRWIGRQGLFNQTARQDELKSACENWLLDRLEDKRYWPRIELQSAAQLADRASADADFMQVAGLYRGRADFDLAALVAELVEGESVPFLPILCYKASGLRKREVWERTWDMQRQEDERAKQRQALEEKLKRIRTRTEKNFESDYATLKKMEAALKKDAVRVRDSFAPHVELEDEWNGSRSFLALQSEELDGEGGRAVKVLAKAKKEALDFHTSIAKKIDQVLAKDDDYQAALTELDGIPDDPEIPVPPKYATADFQKTDYWRLRKGLDVPKERWISYPHCQPVSDPTLVVGWAGWNHLEQATALVTYYDARKREGWDAKRLTPLLAGLLQLLPWLHQWHPEIDKEFGETAGKSYQSMLEQDAHELGLTLEDIRTWQPPETTARRRTRK